RFMQPRILQLRRLVIGEAGRFPELGRTFYEQGPGRTIAALARRSARLPSRLRAARAPLATAAHFLCPDRWSYDQGPIATATTREPEFHPAPGPDWRVPVQGGCLQVSRRRGRVLGVVVCVAATFGACVGSAAAAITVTRSELNGGQLRVEGSGAVPNRAITITPGAVRGTSDGNGAFKVQASPYSSSTCQVTVSDG